MAEVIVFAPMRPDDQGLPRARWIAAQNIAALEAASLSVEPILDGQADRQALETALRRDGSGVVLCAHGVDSDLGTQRKKHDEPLKDDAIKGADNAAALDRDNVVLLRGRWVHAVACRIGDTDLPALAVEAGAHCFAGYRGAIHVAWHEDEIPADIRPSLEALAVSTTLLLARGVRDVNQLKRAVQEHVDAIDRWCVEKLDDEATDIGTWARTAQSLASLTLVLPAILSAPSGQDP